MLPNAREPGIHLVCELRPKARVLVLVVVDSVVKLATRVRVNPESWSHLRRALA